MLVEQAPHHKGRKMLSWMMILHTTPRIWQFFVLSIERVFLTARQYSGRRGTSGHSSGEANYVGNY
jgi:hypothetical protein